MAAIEQEIYYYAGSKRTARKLSSDEETRNIPIIILNIEGLTEEEFQVLSKQAVVIVKMARSRQRNCLTICRKPDKPV